ncbi:hypothetical protein [Streptomyces parvulus]|uniref:hypothetical protein n=2 Tax=Streptomyces TaxID=1883 RepID=UPI0037D1AB73
MGIELELHSSRPARKSWRATLLQGSYEHGEALAGVLGSFQRLGAAGRLTAIDPYRDTLMNEQQAATALREIGELRQRCGDGGQLAALDDLARMLGECAATPGSYLRFCGD